MKVCYSVVNSNAIEIFIRMESDDGITIGESMQVLHKGDSFFGITFDQFIADGTGEIEVTTG